MKNKKLSSDTTLLLPEEIQPKKHRINYNQYIQKNFTRAFRNMNPQMNVNLNQSWGFEGNQSEF
jgi:hypothetical protein